MIRQAIKSRATTLSGKEGPLTKRMNESIKEKIMINKDMLAPIVIISQKFLMPCVFFFPGF